MFLNNNNPFSAGSERNAQPSVPAAAHRSDGHGRGQRRQQRRQQPGGQPLTFHVRIRRCRKHATCGRNGRRNRWRPSGCWCGWKHYDPMAAMMAPPSRRMPSSYSTASLQQQGGGGEVDPLAALMAPPPMSRYSMAPPSMAGNGASGMPPINVWKPPPVAAAAPAVTAPAAAPTHEDYSAGSATADQGASGHAAALGPPPLN